MGAAILDNDVFRACHRYCLTIGPLRKAVSLTSLNDWSVEQTSCLTALNHWSVEERISTWTGSCLGETDKHTCNSFRKADLVASLVKDAGYTLSITPGIELQSNHLLDYII